MTLTQLQDRVLSRLGEDRSADAVNRYYTDAEAATWINAAQRLLVLLTLCLESTQSFTLSSNTCFYRMLTLFDDWMLPLRLRWAGGKITAARLSDLAALDAAWSISPGDPQKYALVGFDLLAIYQQPTEAVVTSLTYARCPAVLVNASDVPEVPAEYHPCLIDAAIVLLRLKEGAQEWQKTLPLFDRFMSEASRLAEYVRARNKEQGYDYQPFELARFDRSRLIQAAKVVSNG